MTEQALGVDLGGATWVALSPRMRASRNGPLHAFESVATDDDQQSMIASTTLPLA
jgi:hypothetical protein